VWDKSKLRTDQGTALLALVMVVTLVGGFVGLSIAGLDTAEYTLFLAGPAVSAAVGTVLAGKVKTVQATVAKVEAQTNGIASAAAKAVEAHLVLQDQAAAQVATDASEHRERLAESPAGPPYVVPSDGP
jgi:hypothetical protein